MGARLHYEILNTEVIENSKLEPREKIVLRMRLGIDGIDKRYTYEELSKIIKYSRKDKYVSRERVKQIESRALRKLIYEGKVKINHTGKGDKYIKELIDKYNKGISLKITHGKINDN